MRADAALLITDDAASQASSLRRALLLTWGVLGLSIVVPLLAWEVTAGSVTRISGWWLPLILIAWSGARLALLIAQGQPRLAEFSTWLFIYLFMGIAPALQMRNGVFPNTTLGVPAELSSKATVIVLVSIVCMEIGLWLARHYARSAPPRAGEIAERRAVLLAYAGIVFAIYYLATIGFSALFITRNELAVYRGRFWPDTTVQAIVVVLTYIPLLVAVHALVRTGRIRKAAGLPPRNRILTMLCLVLLLLIINPVSTPRYVFGTVVLSLIFLAGAFRTATRTRVTLLGITAALVFVFPYADVFRTPYGGANETGLAANFTSNGDYDAFAQLVNTVGFVEANGTTQGRQLLGVALFWVPRSMWSEKPVDTGILLANYKGYKFTNLSAPVWSEMYINAAWPAVVISSLLLGFFIGRGSERIAFHDRFNTPAAIGLGIFSFYLLILLRGSLLQAMANLLVLVSCILFVRNRPTAASAGPAEAHQHGAAPRLPAAAAGVPL